MPAEMTFVPGSPFCAQYERGLDALAIRVFTWFTDRTKRWRDIRYSHMGMIVDANGTTVEARAKGIVRDNIGRYFKEGSRAHVRIWEPIDGVAAERLRAAAEALWTANKGDAYPFLQTFVGIPIVWIVRNVFRARRFVNPFGAGINCVELCVRVFDSAEMPLGRRNPKTRMIEPLDENSTPEDGRDACDVHIRLAPRPE